VSRRTLELRFSEILGKGVGETLSHERLDHVSRLLRETDRTILDICFDSGFQSPSYLKALFKKTYGMTMSKWRGNGQSAR
jgi:transcriptional regulator GlxA family with amidase domain